MSKESTAQIEKAAGDWLARRDAGLHSPQEQQAFDDWISRSTLHRVAYLRLENAWEDALRLKALGAGIQSGRPPAPGYWNLSPFFSSRMPPNTGRERGIRLAVRGLAASLLLVAVMVAAWEWWPTGKSYETAVGGLASVPMADGSKVTLNTDSEIKVAISETERRIDLEHGEAFFEVARDPGRPFVVRVGDKRIVALGTKFSVRRDAHRGSDDIEVVVTEGAVRVESASGKGVENAAARRLAAGSVVRANRDGLMVQRKQVPEVEEQLSWRSGVLVFREVTLAQAAAEFNRYNERKIQIVDPAIGTLQVSGNFRTTNVDAFVRLLEQGYPVRASPRGGDLTLSAR